MALLMVSVLAKAQFYMGAKVGLNMANITASYPNMAFNKKFGINGGATVKYNFQNYLGVQADVLFSQMGSKSKEVTLSDDGAGGTITTVDEALYDLPYIQIPVFVNFEIPIRTENLVPYRLTETVVSVHLCAGGYFGYGLPPSVTYSSKSTTVDVDGNTTIDVAPKTNYVEDPFFAYNPIDFGIVAGAGVSFKLSSKGRFTVDARYMMGMSNMNATGAFLSDFIPFTTMKNKAPQIQLGYIHRISKLKRWQIL